MNHLRDRAPGPVQDPNAVAKDDDLAPDRDFGAEIIDKGALCQLGAVSKRRHFLRLGAIGVWEREVSKVISLFLGFYWQDMRPLIPLLASVRRAPADRLQASVEPGWESPCPERDFSSAGLEHHLYTMLRGRVIEDDNGVRELKEKRQISETSFIAPTNICRRHMMTPSTSSLPDTLNS